MLKILLNAGTSPNLGFAYGLFLVLTTIISVKIALTWRQSAGVRCIHTSEASQRLHAEDLTKKKENKKFISTNTFNPTTLKPYYVTGFSDGEASFHISVLKNKQYKTGYHVLPVFSIQLHIKDLLLLEQIKDYFKVGIVRIKKNKDGNTAIYSVQSYKDIINKIIPHFDKYLLLTQKRADYILFKQILDLINKGKHLTNQGLTEIISIKSSMNKGLNENLKQEFNKVIPVQRPEVELNNPLLNNPLLYKEWLIGFIEAEGCFLCLVRKNVNHTIGYQVTLNFTLTQHSKDLALMTMLKENFGLGLMYENLSIVRWVITKKSDIDTLITLLNSELIGAKSLDLKDFTKVQEIINSGLHKTEEGLNQILDIKRNMNRGRKND